MKREPFGSFQGLSGKGGLLPTLLACHPVTVRDTRAPSWLERWNAEKQPSLKRGSLPRHASLQTARDAALSPSAGVPFSGQPPATCLSGGQCEAPSPGHPPLLHHTPGTQHHGIPHPRAPATASLQGVHPSSGGPILRPARWPRSAYLQDRRHVGLDRA